jgi:hypothetical protein
MTTRTTPTLLSGAILALALLAFAPTAAADPCVESGKYCVEVRGSNVCLVTAGTTEVATCAGAGGVCTHYADSSDGVTIENCPVLVGGGGHSVCILYSTSYSSPPPTYHESYVACL